MIYALHGFLGLPADWDFLKNHFSTHAKLNVLAEDLSQEIPNLNLKEWAQKKSIELSEKYEANEEPRVLLGYSMGGRIAMHLVLAQPQFWDAIILISANPGTASVAEREARKLNDHKWAQKFLNDNWSGLIKDWNSQSLFIVKNPSENQIHLKRNESDFNRKALAAQLERWSLASQDDLALKLTKITKPLLWIAGEEDEKYCDLLSGFAQLGSHRFEKVAKAAHRVPWDNPNEFILLLEKFLGFVQK